MGKEGPGTLKSPDQTSSLSRPARGITWSAFWRGLPGFQRREPGVPQEGVKRNVANWRPANLVKRHQIKSPKCPVSQRETSAGQIWHLGCQSVTSESESNCLMTKKKTEIKEVKVPKQSLTRQQ